MKKIIYVILAAVIIFTACQTKTKFVPVDKEAVKISVIAFLDEYNSAFKAKKANTLIPLITENGLFCGTDPSEIWNYKQTCDGWTQAFADTSLKINYTIDNREVLVAEDGNSAIAVDQLFMKLYSPKIPWRIIYHVVKSGESWKIDFISWNFIPKNEDIEKLNKAME
jgi:hypothetical protein